MNSEKQIKNIDTLRASIRLGWIDLGKLDLPVKEREGIKKHIQWCQFELKQLDPPPLNKQIYPQ